MENESSFVLLSQIPENKLEGRAEKFSSLTCENYRFSDANHLKHSICLDTEVVERRGLMTLEYDSSCVSNPSVLPVIYDQNPEAGLLTSKSDCNTCRYNTSFKEEYVDSSGK